MSDHRWRVLWVGVILGSVPLGCGGNPRSTATRNAVAPAAEPSEERRGEAENEAENELRLPKLLFTIPDGWQRQAPSSSFLLAEFTLPRAETDEADGRLTVSSAGGSIEANIERWRGQFGGKPENSSQDRIQVDGMDVVIVDLSGEFDDQRSPIAPGTKTSGYRMLAAILPVGGELHFVKAVGPQATIKAHADRIREFVGSAKQK
jgi:hypothetical protein